MSPLSTSSARRALLAALACAIALLAMPGLASAATVLVDGTRLVYEADDGETNEPSISRVDDSNQYDVTDFGEEDILEAGPGCVDSDNQFLVGEEVICTVPGLTEINVTLKDDDDSYDGFSSIPEGVVTNLDLGSGTNSVDDQSGGEDLLGVTNVTGGPGVDDISTYGGDDFVDSGGGNDDLSLGDGDDTAELGAGAEDYAFGGEGDDTLFGDDGIDNLRGSGGDDEIHGGAGNDDLTGEDGVDDLSGDAGNDELTGDASSTPGERFDGDILRGGAGTDTANYASWRTSEDWTQAISLDGRANDGHDEDEDGVAEEGDNVGPAGDIEIVEAGDGNDYLEGSDRAETLDGGWGDDGIAGLGGGDEINAGVGDDVVLGGAGDDDIEGSSNKDVLHGEEGNDSISGSTGDDEIDGGPGIDTIDAGGDNDVVLAQDGEVDQIGCGVGGDVAEVDFFDVVNADPGSLCETLIATNPPVQPAPGGGSGGGGGTGPGAVPTNPGTGNPNAGTIASFSAVAGQTLTSVLNNGILRLSGVAPGPGIFDVTAQINRGTAKKAKIAAKKWVKIGTGRATASAAGNVSIPVRLTSRARKGLKKKKVKRVSVRLVMKFTGADGTSRTSTKTVTLKKKKKK